MLTSGRMEISLSVVVEAITFLSRRDSLIRRLGM
jgi:hypothetical protein